MFNRLKLPNINRLLHQHIHATAYYLNPKFYFSDTFRVDAEVQVDLDKCIWRLVIYLDLCAFKTITFLTNMSPQEHW